MAKKAAAKTEAVSAPVEAVETRTRRASIGMVDFLNLYITACEAGKTWEQFATEHELNVQSARVKLSNFKTKFADDFKAKLIASGEKAEAVEAAIESWLNDFPSLAGSNRGVSTEDVSELFASRGLKLPTIAKTTGKK